MSDSVHSLMSVQHKKMRVLKESSVSLMFVFEIPLRLSQIYSHMAEGMDWFGLDWVVLTCWH